MANQAPVNVATGTPFETALLRLLGAPETPANFKFLNQWQLREHGNYDLYANNPFFTTAGGGGSARDVPAGTFPTIPNTPGVTIFPTVTSGTVATERTLEQYPSIWAAIASGNPSSFAGNSGFQAELTRWSGSGYSGFSGISAPSTPQGPVTDVTIEGASAKFPGGVIGSVLPPAAGQKVGDIAAGGRGVIGDAAGAIASPFTSIFDLLKWFWNPKNLARIAEVIGGGVLILLGIIMLGSAASSPSGSPVRDFAGASRTVAKVAR